MRNVKALLYVETTAVSVLSQTDLPFRLLGNIPESRSLSEPSLREVELLPFEQKGNTMGRLIFTCLGGKDLKGDGSNRCLLWPWISIVTREFDTLAPGGSLQDGGHCPLLPVLPSRVSFHSCLFPRTACRGGKDVAACAVRSAGGTWRVNSAKAG